MPPESSTAQASSTAFPVSETIHAFFEQLYPGVDDGYLLLSSPHPTRLTKQGKPALASSWHNLKTTPLQRIATRAATQAKQSTVYFGVVVQRPDSKPDPFHRSTNDGAYIVPGLWFDLDLTYGQHAASTLPQTDGEALDFLHSLPAAPSLIIHSGGGMYPWWLFKEPYRITNAAEHDEMTQLAERFNRTLCTRGKAHGWTLDTVGDLARVLRPPGTINHKYGKLVELIHDSGLRYTPSDFDWLEPPRPPAMTTRNGTVIPGQPDLGAIAEHYGTVLEAKSATELAGAHPVHGSSTGDNFNVNLDKGLWRCWRHGTGGDAFSLIAVCEGIIDCDQAVKGALRAAMFTRVVEIANTTFHAGIVLGGRTRTGSTPAAAETPTAAADPPLPWSDYTNARALVREFGERLRYCWPWKKWLTWAGSHWQLDDTGAVRQLAKEVVKRLARQVENLETEQAKALLSHVKRSLNTASLKAMIEAAQDEPGIPVLPDDLDADRWLLNVQNGTIDLKKGTLQPHQPTHLITKCLPVAYDPAATCPAWDAFLLRIMGGSATRDTTDMSTNELEARHTADTRAKPLIGFLQRAIGYSLTGDTREQCLFVLHGSGANGKSTLLELLQALLGGYAQSTPSASLLVKDRHEGIPNDIARLRGARLVTAVEIGEGKRLNEELVKRLTGQDTMTARFLHAEFFDFTPEFKLLVACNHLPTIKGTDHAIWRRVKLIPFTVTIPDDEQDSDLPAKLKAELPGILRWAVQGCLDWQKSGLGTPEEVKAATQDYRASQDVLGAFLAERCVVKGDRKIKASQLYKEYQDWCTASGEHALVQRNFGIRLSERGLESYKVQGMSWWRGIGAPQKDEEAK